MEAARHGWALLHASTIVELKTDARLFQHVRTGAQLLSLENDDENKVFGASFRTPPTDSTGIAHILEHAVLCGSRRYPLKDLFAQLVKGSLNTFLNAFTYPDKTCYPLASQNLQDFYNLVNAYLDIVFYPRLDRATFLEQGWHYEIDPDNDALAYKGVVFNEMKGARSAPDGVLYDHTKRALFPDTTYGVDGGGNPKHIPDLTFEQLQAFHRRHYHPSNARLFFHGDDDPDERLRLLDGWLRDFEPRPANSDVGLQKRFEAPRKLVRPYAVGDDDTSERKGFLVVSWLLDETAHPETALGLQILGHLLIGTPASPLRKALIDSGLGEDLAGDGFEGELRQMYFGTGLKNIAPRDADQVERLILETLRGLADDGIAPEVIEASLNTVEFGLRENNTGSFPRGLSLMLRALTTWLHDGDPFAPLAFDAPLTTIKARTRSEPYFEHLIRRYLVDNPHRVTLLLQPDATLARRDKEAEQARLQAARAAMTATELLAIGQTNRQLKQRQEAPDPPDALAAVPALKRSDLQTRNKPVPFVLVPHGKTQTVYHELWTNHILYLDFGFDLHLVPPTLLPYASLWGRALFQIGTEHEDFVQLTQRINRQTGGLRRQLWTATVREHDHAAARLFLRAKAMPSQADDLLAILRDVLLAVRLDNRERFGQMVLEEKARLEARLVPNGTGFVDGRLRARFDEAGWASEQTTGIDYLFFLRQLAERVENDWPRVLADLEQLHELLVNRSALVVNATMDADDWTRFEPRLQMFLANLPARPRALVPWNFEQSAPRGEGWVIPAAVNYVGKAANLYALGLPAHGSALVASKYLSATWLWERVRVAGGAYGGYCAFDRLSGVFRFLSYRDPNLLDTLAVYDQAGRFLREADVSASELTRTVVGTIGDLDLYQLPDAKGFTSLTRHLSNDTDDARQRLRDEILSTGASDFARFADALEAIKDNGVVCVLGAQAALDAANQTQPASFHVSKVL